MSKISGHCLCGNVTYESPADAMFTALCHCDDCKRQSGGAFSVNVAVPREGFTVSGESLATFETVGTDTEQPRDRVFCSACGSPLITYAKELPELALIKAGTLDDQSWLQPQMEIWTESSHDWLQIAGERQQHPRGL